jgi:hypothetical protein
MSKYLYAAVVLACAWTMIPVVTPAAAAIEYPWCAQYSGNGGRNCGFSTYQQCREDVSGIGGFCQRNLFYQGNRHRH